MGNFSGGRELPSKGAPIRAFYSTGAWIEGAALRQADHVAQFAGMQALALFPDLHPGKHGPTGMAALADRLYPQLVGNDIGCGMALFALDLPVRKFKLDRAEHRLRGLMDHAPFDVSAELAAVALPGDLWPHSLGDIGGGNHFCEVQAVGKCAGGLDRERLHLLVHSGSRGLGASIFERVRASGPLTEGLDPDSKAGCDWLARHDQAVIWAALNRRLIAARAAAALGAGQQLVADVAHNLVRPTAEGFVHHKGAASVYPGMLAPVAGSRATSSYAVSVDDGVAGSLGAISHGAGRKHDRASMHGRVGRTRSERDDLMYNRYGGKLICDDRNLVIEEAALAYKNAEHVVMDLVQMGLVSPVAEMRPQLTYKKAVEPEIDADRRSAHRRRQRERRNER